MNKKVGINNRIKIVIVWFAGLIITNVGGLGIIFSQYNPVPQWFVGLFLVVFFIGFFMSLSFPIMLCVDLISFSIPKGKMYKPKEVLIKETNKNQNWS